MRFAATDARSDTSTTTARQDLLSIRLNEGPSLLRNDIRGKQNWIQVKLEGVKSDRNAGSGRLWWKNTGADHFESTQLLCLQRYAPAFRAREHHCGGSGSARTERTSGVLQAPAGPLTDQRARRCCTRRKRGWSKIRSKGPETPGYVSESPVNTKVLETA